MTDEERRKIKGIMCGIRYEFGNVGIFHALEMLDACDMERNDAEDLYWAEEKMDRKLFAPSSASPRTYFFTEKGDTDFSDALMIMERCFRKYLEDAGLGEFKKIKLNISPTDFVYQDEYQFAIKEDHYQQLIKI